MNLPTEQGLYVIQLEKTATLPERTARAYYNPRTNHWLKPERDGSPNIGHADRITIPGESEERTIIGYAALPNTGDVPRPRGNGQESENNL